MIASVIHCLKSVRIPSYSALYFPAFGLHSVRIQSECGKIRTRIAPDTYPFYVVIVSSKDNIWITNNFKSTSIIIIISLLGVIISIIIGTRVVKKILNYILIAVILISIMVIIIILINVMRVCVEAIHLNSAGTLFSRNSCLKKSTSPFIDPIWSFKLVIYSLK